MTKIKNLHIYPKTVGERDRLVEEYRSIGFYVESSEGKVTVYALPKKEKTQAKKKYDRPRRDRD
jgi:hypothetical protein